MRYALYVYNADNAASAQQAMHLGEALPVEDFQFETPLTLEELQRVTGKGRPIHQLIEACQATLMAVAPDEAEEARYFILIPEEEPEISAEEIIINTDECHEILFEESIYTEARGVEWGVANKEPPNE